MQLCTRSYRKDKTENLALDKNILFSERQSFDSKVHIKP